MIPSPDVKELSVKDYIALIRKHVWLLVGIVVISTGFVAIRDYTSPKIYKVDLKIILKKRIARVTGAENVIYRGGTPQKEDQENMLISRTLAEKVIKELGLLVDPLFRNSKDPQRTLLSMVSVNSKPKSTMVFVTVRGSDPLKITKIANTWGKSFIELDIDQKIETARHGISWLKDQLKETLGHLQESEKKLNNFIKVNRIVTIPDVGVKKEGLIESLKKQTADLEKEIKEASERYKEKHPTLVYLKASLEAVVQKMKEQKDDLFDLQDKSLEYKVLKREVGAYQHTYDTLLKRIGELEISKDMVVTNIQIIDEAHLPSKPYSPQPAKDILQALLVSFALGVGIIFFIEYLDSTLKTPDDVEIYAQFPFLGSIPSAKKEIDEKEIDLICSIKPRSQVAEAFRNLRVSLAFCFPEDKPLQVMCLTSAVAKEGKSFTCVNLATVFAQTKEEVLIIDADMRRSRLGKVFSSDESKGLSSLLAGICSLEEVVHHVDSIPHLSFLPSGPTPPNPSELLSSKKLRDVLEEAKKRYTKIIIDAPPSLGLSDALLLSSRSDGLIFVIKGGSTSIQLIRAAKRILERRTKVVGAILNNVNIKKDRDYSYHYYDYSSDKET